MSCHTSRLLGSLFYYFYKSDLLQIGQQSKTAGLRLSCVVRIQFGCSSIQRQPLIPSMCGITMDTILLNRVIHTTLLSVAFDSFDAGNTMDTILPDLTNYKTA